MPERNEIAAVVLAAGAARRFGADKLISPVTRDGLTMPLAAHALLPWLSVFARIAVVVRPNYGSLRLQVETALGDTGVRSIDWIVCAEAERGMGRSLACGVAANRDAAGWLIGLADMPSVPIHAIAQVRMALASGALLAAPFYHNQRGHPVGIAGCYRNELLALDGDRGAKNLLERNAAAVWRVETDDAGVLKDIDIPSDLVMLAEKSNGNNK